MMFTVLCCTAVVRKFIYTFCFIMIVSIIIRQHKNHSVETYRLRNIRLIICFQCSTHWNADCLIFTARCYASAVMPHVVYLSLCPSVRPSVTFRYSDHIGWNISKIISRLISLRFMLGLVPTWAIWCNGSTPKIRVE